MISIKKMMWLLAAVLVPAVVSRGAGPGFHDTSAPEGWTYPAAGMGTGSVVSAKTGGKLELKTTEPVGVPVSATFRFRGGVGDGLTVSAWETTNAAAALVRAGLQIQSGVSAGIGVSSDNRAMSTELMSSRTWVTRNKPRGGVQYIWRFPNVKNLWDDVDRKEIGSDFSKLQPFDEKVFTMRIVLTDNSRQIWVDDRLVAEDKKGVPKEVNFVMQLGKGVRVLSAEFSKPVEGEYLPLCLAHYSHEKSAVEGSGKEEPVTVKSGKNAVPVYLPKDQLPDLNLGESLYRYRMTKGTGPNAPYVNANHVWPTAFNVDPAQLTFRVPYRHYQNAWLAVWKDDAPNTVAKGTFRFYRHEAGYPASTDFEISDATVKSGLVTKLDRKAGNGKDLYLIRVPVETDGFYGFRDTTNEFLEFQISKPVALIRSYPDPIYYGYHPSGWPSSLHVVGITLEEAPFDYQVKPKEYEFVFEQPEKQDYTVAVTNTTGRAITAKVTLQTKSYDGEEKTSVSGEGTVKPGETGNVELSLDVKKLGWHELNVRVEANGVTRTNTLSMVLLPPNRRTYGYAANETRFGIWMLAGHYLSLAPGDFVESEKALAMYRKLGLRQIGTHAAHFPPELAKKYDFLPTGPHTIITVFHQLDVTNMVAVERMITNEVAQAAGLARNFDKTTYFYGGEWGVSPALQYAPWPRYTGDPLHELTDDEKSRLDRQTKIFTYIGKAMRVQQPKTRLFLQWGSPQGSLAYIQYGMAQDLVDGFGMDAPMFELLPETSNAAGSINNLWMLRAEAKRMGWPRLPIHWCEGPFFPTNPGALTKVEQLQYQMRYMILGLGYGVEQFEGGVVPQDAGNYYGAEHYGAGVFERTPLENPKPAVAAIATMTSMLCGCDPVGGLDTGCATTYCMEFVHTNDQAKVYSLWRVNGTEAVTVHVSGGTPVVTDAMGNATKPTVKDGAIVVTLSSTPVWLTGAEKITGFTAGQPVYMEAPAAITKTLAKFSADQWTYDASKDKDLEENEFTARRITDPNLKVDFESGEEGHADVAAVTLGMEDGSRPLANRYGALKPKTRIEIPGKAQALGVWVKGNSSWGRVIYQLRDAKGELWTSIGSKEDWNCDDTHGWSYVNFEGWRYVRFPLPGNTVYDNARELEMTWWGSRGGDGIVDLPLTVEKIIFEDRNEVPYLSEMKTVSNRTYKVAGLVAEYASAADEMPEILAQYKLRKPVPDWEGPTQNPLAKLTEEGTGDVPVIKGFDEPGHFNDGRSMNIRFDAAEGKKYNLYLGRYADGRGAELLKANVKDKDLVSGLRAEMKMYMFLVSVGADKKESKPSPAFELVTHDNFLEK